MLRDMPRTSRIFQRAVCYHLTNRGINTTSIFATDEDRSYFSDVVRDYKDICGAKLYHWSWMGTHFHMLAEVVYQNLRPFVGGIEQVYAQYHHRCHGSRGVFWQGRFKSRPVEIGQYLVRCGRYIERNPVRAGLVEQAWDYPWSSAAFYVQGREDGMTDANPYTGAEKMTAADRRRYGKELMGTADEEWMQAHRRARVLGSESFAGQLKMAGGRFRRRRGRPVKSV